MKLQIWFLLQLPCYFVMGWSIGEAGKVSPVTGIVGGIALVLLVLFHRIENATSGIF